MDDSFPELIAKNGGFRTHFLAIPDIIAPFPQIRYKTAPKMIPNGAFWMGDRLPDGEELVENEKKGCFGASKRESAGVYRREFYAYFRTPCSCKISRRFRSDIGGSSP